MLATRPNRRKISTICYVVGFGVLFLLYGTLSLIGYELNTKETADYKQQHLESDPAVLDEFNTGHHGTRHLLFVLPNCTPPAIEQFPPSAFSQQQRRQGAVVLYILGALYMFIGLAIACDDYFVPSLEKICTAMKLQPDVAGATFMAAGSSAPELATAIIGVFIAKDDIGLGAVVGSAVFNILFVVSVCALFAGAVVHLHWWPLIRDSLFYLISIIALSVIIFDEKIHWYESVILLLLYVLYIVLMYFNPTIERLMVTRLACCPRHGRDCPEVDTIHPPEKVASSHGSLQLTSAAPSITDDSEESGLDPDEDFALLPSNGQHTNHHTKQLPRTQSDCRPVKKDEEEYTDKRLSFPEGCGWRVLWTMSLPLIILMYFTIPDTRIWRWRHWFMVTFLMSCVWISLYSYFMVWMITVIGHTFHIPDTVMALTFIAAGVSVPDAIASLIVVREGEGDMAVSNAVGSNVFDILVCLGLPWFMKTCIIQPNTFVPVYSAGLLYATITLFSTVILLVGATWLNGWRLSRRYGAVLMVAYVLVTVLTTLYELNFFGYVHPIECPSLF